MLKIALLFLYLGSPHVVPRHVYDDLSAAAVSLIDGRIAYDPTYVSIPYPNGDVAPGKGVCTDVVIRAYRLLGVDLQREVHEDMLHHFNVYPRIWGLSKPDANIDHRRVQNLQVFFERHHASLPVSNDPAIYRSGDVVTWDLGRGIVHIGIVVDRLAAADHKRHLIVHNKGNGQELSDCLFDFRITGHYRYRV